MQSVQLENKSHLKITGVEGVIGLTETGATIMVNGEILEIKGNNLKCEKLSVECGEMIIIGEIYSINYKEKSPKKSFLKRIFK